jgi:4-amino-4-deoxy-L-arabinose transferase-like glycosyltransferase/Tfp pilus assembly protein PilF
MINYISAFIKFIKKHKYLFLLFFLGLIIRIIYLFFLSKNPILLTPVLDAEYYLEWAKEISTNSFWGNKVFFAEPLYAYILALLMMLSPSHVITLTISIQVILGSFLSVIVFLLTKKIFDRSTGLIAGIITAFYGPFIFYDFLLLKTSLEVFLLTLFILFFIITTNSAKKWRYIISGILLGIIVILKGTSLILLPFIITFILLYDKQAYKQQLIRCCVFILGFLLVVFPVTFRNYLISKDFVLTNYSIGMNIYQGNWWGGDGSLKQPYFIRAHPRFEEVDSYKMAEAFKGRDLKPSEVSGFWINKTIAENLDNPFRLPKLIGNKILILLNNTELGDNYDYNVYKKAIPFLNVLPDFRFILPVGLTGLLLFIFSKRFFQVFKNQNSNTKTKSFLVFTILLYSLVIIVGHVNSRYRLPLIPLFIILASAALKYLYINFRKKDYFQVFLIGMITIIFLFISSINIKSYNVINRDGFYEYVIGSLYNTKGDLNNAKKYLEQAANKNRKDVSAYKNLFLIYLHDGELDKANDVLQKQLNLSPYDLTVYSNAQLFNNLKGKDSLYIKAQIDKQMKISTESAPLYDPYNYEALRYISLKNYVSAENYLNLSINKFNRPENSLFILASVERIRGNISEESSLLKELIQRNPYNLAARYNLAKVFLKQSDHTQATKQLSFIYNFAPDYSNVWYSLAKLYIKEENYKAASLIIQTSTNRYKSDLEKNEKLEELKLLLKEKEI